MMTKNHTLFFFAMLVICGKVAGFGKDLLLSYYHGASQLTDSFFIANSLASLFYASLYLSVPTIIIPYYSRIIVELNNLDYKTELYSLCQSFVIISAILTIIVFNSADFLVQLSFPELSYNTKKAATGFLKIISLTFCFSTVVALCNSIQVVNGTKFLSFVVPVVNNFAFIVSLLIFTNTNEFKNILWAGFISWLSLSIVNVLHSKELVSFKLTTSFPLLTKKSILITFLPALIGFYIEQVNNYISIFFASNLGEGGVSIISYANKINLILVSIFMIFLNVYIFPKLASSRFQTEVSGIASLSTMIFKWILIISIPLTFILFIYSNPIVSVLFERGQFTYANTLSVASVLSIFSLSLPALLLRDLLNRIVFSFENTTITMFSLLISVTLHGVLSFHFSREYGLNGIAIAAVLSSVVNIILLLIFLRVYFGIQLISTTFKDIFICFFALSLACTLSSIIFRIVDLGWFLDSVFISISYLIALHFLGLKEITSILAKLSLIVKNYSIR